MKRENSQTAFAGFGLLLVGIGLLLLHPALLLIFLGLLLFGFAVLNYMEERDSKRFGR